MPLFLLLIVGITVWLLYRQPEIGGRIQAVRANMNTDIDFIFQKYGDQFGLDWKLLKAVATQESGLNPNAVNPRDPSVGLMQILCRGYPSTVTCQNKFNIRGWPPETGEQLKDPDYNVYLGAQILKWNIDTYGLRKGIAVYNNWNARDQTEPFSNQNYLERIMKIYEGLL